MIELADRLRETTVILRPEYAQQLNAAVAEVSDLKSLRALDLLSFARAAFPSRATADDLAVVSETFRRRKVEGDGRARQLWSTLAGLVLINRFERGPTRLSDARVTADSVGALAVEVLAYQGFSPVHPDVVIHAERWSVTTAEVLRTRGPVSQPPVPPQELEQLSVGEQVKPPSQTPAEAPAEPAAGEAPEASNRVASISLEQAAALARHVNALTQWASKSGSPGRLAALEEQQDLLWWLQSADSKAKGGSNPTEDVLNACNELLTTTHFFPGPPAARELLKRRLGPIAPKMLSPESLAEKAARTEPSRATSIISLLGGVVSPHQQDAKISALDLAMQLYAEMVLVELLKQSTP